MNHHKKKFVRWEKIVLMLTKRNNPTNKKQISHHQSIHVDSQILQTDWWTKKSRRLFQNICFILHFFTINFRKHLTSAVQILTKLTSPSNGRECYSCESGSLKYYFYCGISGLLSCALTHTAVVPLDLIKCRLQVKAQKYENIIHAFQVTIAEEGIFSLTNGWAPTLIGYSLQGFGKFGFYEIFKNVYSIIFGDDNAYLYRTIIYLLASASAELLADVALAPWEAIKVRMQTQDNWATTLQQGVPKFYAEEGVGGLYKGLIALWLRQIPYTMMKFACFERTIEALYKYLLRKPRHQGTKSEELSMTFLAGYIAGIFCAIVSHPADTIVSKLNNEKGLSLFDAIRRVGFAGLWKGLGPRIFIVGTLSAVQLFFYNTAKVILKVPRTKMDIDFKRER